MFAMCSNLRKELSASFFQLEDHLLLAGLDAHISLDIIIGVVASHEIKDQQKQGELYLCA